MSNIHLFMSQKNTSKCLTIAFFLLLWQLVNNHKQSIWVQHSLSKLLIQIVCKVEMLV